MPVRGLPKLEERWRRERLYRERRLAELRQTVLEAGVPVLESHGVQRAWLFGSVAAGTAGPESDVDILAVPVPPEAFWPLRRDLEAALRERWGQRALGSVLDFLLGSRERLLTRAGKSLLSSPVFGT